MLFLILPVARNGKWMKMQFAKNRQKGFSGRFWAIPFLLRDLNQYEAGEGLEWCGRCL